MFIHVLAPELTDTEIDARWQEVLDDSIHSAEWSVGILVLSSGVNRSGRLGSMRWMTMQKES